VTVTYPIIKMYLDTEILTFSAEEVVSAVVVEESDSISATLPISTIEFSIINTNSEFSMFGGEYFDLLYERLPIRVLENVDGDDVFVGKFYLETWENVSEQVIRFKAIDIVGVMANTTYDGGFWDTEITLEDILEEILSRINVLYTLDDTIKDNEVEGWIPPGTYRAALQHICYSGMAAVLTARSETLDIIPINLPVATYDSVIADSDKSSAQSVELLPLVTTVEIVTHMYTQNADIEDIFSEDLAIGNYKIVFDKPYVGVVINGPGYTPLILCTEGGVDITTENGDTIEIGGEYVLGPNSLYLTLDTAGLVEITGYGWTDNRRALIFTETGLTEFTNKLSIDVAEATMVDLDNGEDVLDVTRDAHRLRYKQNVKLLQSTVKPADIVLTSAFSGQHILARVNKVSLDLTGGYIMEVEMTGIKFPGIYADVGAYKFTGTDATLTHGT